MKRQFVLPACLLLLWTLTASVSCQDAEFKVSDLPDGIKLSCGENNEIKASNGPHRKSWTLDYKDENTGEYTCVQDSVDGPTEGPKIYVKFRTCDNCIELDTAAITGIVVGDVVATIVIGVAVYLIASQSRKGPITPQKKSSDRQHLVPNGSGSRTPNDDYQPLKPRQKQTYDVLNSRSRPTS